MKEIAILFGKTKTLVGIISDPPEPDQSKRLPAVILLNTGVIHRVGPNRLSVRMARNLAEEGFVVLRFDFSGIGDSQVRYDDLPFEESVDSEVQDAMDLLAEIRGVDRFVLMGICSGAANSFKTACLDSRVVGAVLINPQDYFQEVNSYARVRRYWKTRYPTPGVGSNSLWEGSTFGYFSRSRWTCSFLDGEHARRPVMSERIIVH